MKQLARITGFAALAALVLVGCGDETTNVTGLQTVANLQEAGKCAAGDMVFNLEDSQVYICGADNKWGVLKGEKGEDGSSCTARIVDEGVEVSCGGRVLDTLFNGAQGEQGIQGEAGQNCTGRVIDGIGIEVACGGAVVDTLRNGADGQNGADGASCTLASIEVNGLHGVEITCGTQKDTVMNGAQGIQGVQGEPGVPGAAGASCSGVSLGDTAVIISCGDVVVDTLYNGAQGEQGIQGIQGEAGQSCTGRAIDGIGIEISCGGAVVDTLRNGNNNIRFCGNVAYDSNILFCDERDNKLYKWVTIGTQIWMAENLNFGTRVNCNVDGNENYQDNATVESAQKYCYNDSTEYCDAYGGLYQWHTAMAFLQRDDFVEGVIQYPHRGICPAGWHIPDSTEWATLAEWVDNDNGGEENDEGRSLKSVSGWNNDGNGTDAYGFSALPSAGHRYSEGYFFGNAGYYAAFWSSSVRDRYAAYIETLIYNYAYAGLHDNPKASSYAVRCVKD